MKTFFAFVLLAAGLIQSAPTFAESAAAKTVAPAPLLGHWTLDVSRLPMPPEARPKSVTLAFSETDGGKWKIQVDIVDASGSLRRAISTCAPDGSATSIVGDNVEADVGAMKTPAPNVLVLGLGKSKMPASTRVYTVSADGKSMIETAVNFDDVPVMRTHYFTRVR